MEELNTAEIESYKSVEEYQEQRKKVLSRFKNLKKSSKVKSNLLIQYRAFRFFEKKFDEFTSLLDDLIGAVPKENLEDLSNIQAKICKHEDIEAEFSAHESEMKTLEQTGLVLIAGNLVESETIRRKICVMKKKWGLLKSKLIDQIEILRMKQHYLEYSRNYDKLLAWIDKKLNFLRSKKFFTSLEEIEQYIQDFKQIEKKVLRMESEVDEIKSTADFFIKDEFPQSYHVSQKKEQLQKSWNLLKEFLSTKRMQLMEFIRIYKLCCRVNEFLNWIDEKQDLFSKRDFGSNLAEIVASQNKHDVMNRILDKMELRFDDLMEEHDTLKSVHTLHTDGILVRKKDIVHHWLELKIAAKGRGSDLRDHYRIYKYFDDIHEIIDWMTEMANTIATEIIPEEEADAEVVLKIIQVYKDIIDSRKKDLEDVIRIGSELSIVFVEKHDIINDLLSDLFVAKNDLYDLIESQEYEYQSKLSLQKLQRKFDSVEKWMAQRETLLHFDEESLNSLGTIKILIEKHQQFESTFKKEWKHMIIFARNSPDLQILNESVAQQMAQRRDDLRTKYQTILLICKNKLELLNDALNLQKFFSDCDSIQRWINEKLKIVSNEYLIDGPAVSANIATNSLFVNELTTYTKFINEMVTVERFLVKKHHSSAGVIEKRVEQILASWDSLNHKTIEKISKLEEVLDMRTFLLASSKLELELSEYKERLDNQYVFHGSEISNILRVQRNLEALELEVRVCQRKLHTMKLTGLKIIKRGHSQKVKIMKIMYSMLEKHRILTDIIERKQQTIKDALKASEFFMDVEEQMKWITEKITSLSVINTELGLLDVQHLISKHKTKKGEIKVREKEISALTIIGEQMIANNHYDSNEIRERLTIFLDAWNQLKDLYEQYKLKLEEAKRIYDYYAEAELNEAIMKEKKIILSNTDYGINEDTSAALLRRHEIFVEDLRAFGNKIKDLRKQANNCRQMPLSVSAIYQRETVEALKDYTAQKPNELSIQKGDLLTLVNSSNKIWWKVEKEGCQGLVPKECISRMNPEGQNSVCPVSKRQDELEKIYEELMSLTDIRKTNLMNTYTAFVLVREATDITSWIKVKETYALEDDIGENISHLEILQKKFDDFQSDLTEKKIKLIGTLTKTEKLHPFIQGNLAQILLSKTEEMKTRMKRIQELAKNREIQLSSAFELQRFYRDMEEAEDWIQEKIEKLNDADFGDSLKTIRTLLRKHEGMERDLDALEERIQQLNETANGLLSKYSENADHIISKQKEIKEKWSELSEKAICRKQNLLDSYDLQKFFADYNHVMTWINKMISKMKSEERTSDYDSAEIQKMNFEAAILEMEKYETNIKEVRKFGEMIISSNQNMSNDIQDKLEKLEQSCEILKEKRDSRKKLVEENLEIGKVLRECENLEYWLSEKEALINTSGENEQLLKIIKKMENSLFNKEKDIKALQISLNKLTSSGYNALNYVIEKILEVLSRYENLLVYYEQKRLQLKETQTLQQFSLGAAEIEYWIDEKLQQATQQDYRDPVNIKSKLLKHKAFESEIKANTPRVYEVLNSGRVLIDSEDSEKLKEAVQKRLENISMQWNELENKSHEKGEKLKEVSKQYDHIMGIKYMNFWMGDVETLLINQDIGKGLNAVKNLLGQHSVIEGDIEAHWEKIRDLERESYIFTSDSIFDIVSIKEEHQNMIVRYERIKDLAAQRRARLRDKDAVFKLFKVIADEETWMKDTALRIDEENQPKFICDKSHPMYRFNCERF